MGKSQSKCLCNDALCNIKRITDIQDQCFHTDNTCQHLCQFEIYNKRQYEHYQINNNGQLEVFDRLSLSDLIQHKNKVDPNIWKTFAQAHNILP